MPTDQIPTASDIAVVAALSRALDWPEASSESSRGLRADTPLMELGLDELACVLVCDNCAELGWSISEADLAAAHTVADVARVATRV